MWDTLVPLKTSSENWLVANNSDQINTYLFQIIHNTCFILFKNKTPSREGWPRSWIKIIIWILMYTIICLFYMIVRINLWIIFLLETVCLKFLLLFFFHFIVIKYRKSNTNNILFFNIMKLKLHLKYYR